jgi:hypothetical protein
MAATLTTKITFLLNALLQNTVLAQAAQGSVERSPTFSWPTGTGANKADKVYSERVTLAASATETLDLAGALTDALGAALTFVAVKAIILVAAAGNVNDVVMGGAAATQFVGPLGDATDKVKVRPGGFLACIAPDATGWQVGAGTADNLKIANGGGTTGVTFDLIIIGTSA